MSNIFIMDITFIDETLYVSYYSILLDFVCLFNYRILYYLKKKKNSLKAVVCLWNHLILSPKRHSDTRIFIYFFPFIEKSSFYLFFQINLHLNSCVISLLKHFLQCSCFASAIVNPLRWWLYANFVSHRFFKRNYFRLRNLENALIN